MTVEQGSWPTISNGVHIMKRAPLMASMLKGSFKMLVRKYVKGVSDLDPPHLITLCHAHTLDMFPVLQMGMFLKELTSFLVHLTLQDQTAIIRPILQRMLCLIKIHSSIKSQGIASRLLVLSLTLWLWRTSEPGFREWQQKEYR